MLATLRQRNFALLWWGGLISMIGNWMLLIGLPLYVYQLTDSTLATSVTFISQLVPGVVLSSVTGVFADRWDRQRVLVVASVLQAIVLLPLLAVRAPEDLWIVYAVGFIGSVIAKFSSPAENALLPRLVSEEYLIPANSLNALNNNLARLFGPAIGGAAIAAWGLTGVTLLDAASFLLAGGMVAFITTPARPDRERAVTYDAGGAGAWALIWREWADGMRLVKRDRILAGAFSVIAVAAFADAIVGPLWVVFVYEILRQGAAVYGWLSPAQAIGGLAGSFLLARAGSRLGLSRLIALSAVVIGVVELVMFNFPSLLLTLTLFPVAGAAVVGLYTGLQTLLQTGVEDRYRGRIFGAYGTTTALLTLVGMGLGGVLGDIVAVPLLLNLAGSLYILSGVVARIVLRDAAAVESGIAEAEGRETPIAPRS